MKQSVVNDSRCEQTGAGGSRQITLLDLMYTENLPLHRINYGRGHTEIKKLIVLPDQF